MRALKRAGWLALFPAMLLIVNPISEHTDWLWPVRVRAWWESY